MAEERFVVRTATSPAASGTRSSPCGGASVRIGSLACSLQRACFATQTHSSSRTLRSLSRQRSPVATRHRLAGQAAGSLAWLLALALLLSLCALLAPAAHADGPIRLVSSAVRSEYPKALHFDIEVADDVADIVSIQLAFHPRGERSDTIAPLTFSPARQVRASYTWKTHNITIPPFVPIEYYWQITDKAGNRLRTEVQTAVYDDVRFTWQVATSGDVSVFWYVGSEEVGQQLLDTAVSALQRLSAAIKANVEYPIRIVMYGSEEDFKSAFPYVNEWVGGRAFPEAALIVGYAEPRKPSMAWTLQEVIPHEISHILFYQATYNPYSDPPTWLNEGLAMYNEQVSQDAALSLLWRAVQRGQTLSLAQISGNFPRDEYVAALSYTHSLSVVQFILERYGSEAMASFVHAFKDGKTTEEAIRHAFGVSPEEFEAAWKEYLTQLPPPEDALPYWWPIEGLSRSRLGLLCGGLVCCGGVLLAGMLITAIVLLRRWRAERSADR